MPVTPPALPQPRQTRYGDARPPQGTGRIIINFRNLAPRRGGADAPSVPRPIMRLLPSDECGGDAVKGKKVKEKKHD